MRGYLIQRGALEPQFYAAFLKGLNLNPKEIPDRNDRSQWETLRDLFTRKLSQKTQREWEEIFDRTDSCVTPVLPLTANDTRPIARLCDSPGRDLRDLKPEMLRHGSGTKEVLKAWVGWTPERDYFVDANGTVNITSRSKL